MLWVYDHYKYFYSYSAGIEFSRQNLTSTDVRFWRQKSIPALYGSGLGQLMNIYQHPLNNYDLSNSQTLQI